jgi:hypothetical protein
MIMERILHACIGDLMGKDHKKEIPPEENLEALCNLLMTGAWTALALPSLRLPNEGPHSTGRDLRHRRSRSPHGDASERVRRQVE